MVDAPSLTKTPIPEWVRKGLGPWTIPAQRNEALTP